ncbi:MAG: DUF4836 family protein [Bacteroidota bacterium]
MKKNLLPWLIPAWLICMTACSSKSLKEAAYIPKDASLVAVVNVKELKTKFKKSDLNIDSLLTSLINQQYIKSSPTKMGDTAFTVYTHIPSDVELKMEKLICFVQSKTMADNSIAYSINIISSNEGEKMVSDSTTLRLMKDFNVQEEKSFKTFFSTMQNARVSWNDEIGMVTFYFHEPKPVYDTLEMIFKMPAKPNIENESKAEVAQFFNQALDKSMASVVPFTEMFKEKADGYLFTSSNSSIATLKNSPLNLPKLEELLKDNYTAATLHFEAGKMRIQSTNYVNPLLGSLFRQYAGPVVNWSLVNDYPQGEINMLALASFQPALIGGFLQQLELKSFADNYLSKSGLTLDEILKAFKGELAVVASDIKMQDPDPMKRKDELSLQRGMPAGKLFVRLPVGEKASYQKLMETAVKNGWLVKRGKVYQSAPDYSLPMFVMGDENNLFIASDSTVYAEYLAAAGKKNTFLTGSPFQSYKAAAALLYMNIASTFRGLTPADESYSYHRASDIIASTLKEMTVVNDNFDGKAAHSNLEITMQDTKTNSLVSLTKMVAALSKEFDFLKPLFEIADSDLEESPERK